MERQRRSPITVIIGNPPYNVGQLNENDNNKNRKYKVIDQRIKQTYAKASKATLNTKLYDPYVKFFRWAVDRLAGRDGVVCLVTNNSFVEQIAFDGMRKHLMQDFTRVYHLHLEGNVRQNPTLAGSIYNVFGIQVGVGVTVAVRSSRHADRRLFFQHVDKSLRKEAKLEWLSQHSGVGRVDWQALVPDPRYNWLLNDNAEEFAGLVPLGSKEAKAGDVSTDRTIVATYSLGVSTNRDDVVYDFNRPTLLQRVESFCEAYNAEIDRFKRKGKGVDLDEFIDYSDIKWSENLKRSLKSHIELAFDSSLIRRGLYRPFTSRFLYLSDVAVDRPGLMRRFFRLANERDNQAIAITALGSEKPFMALLVDEVCDLHLVGAGAGAQCFPFYVYDQDGTNRRENITDWSLNQFRTHYGDNALTKWDIFYYVYGLLHHPGYRAKFADNLKRDLPRIPFAPDFRAFAAAGKELARLHLDYEQLTPYPLKWVESDGVPLSYRVEDKMRLNKDKTAVRVNPSLALEGVPPETLLYRLGNRSALDWVIDQYQVTEDKRSGIRSDPNRPDDPEYIVRLVGQVVRVSVETVRIVAALPEQFAE